MRVCAQPSLDSTHLADLVERSLAADPSLLIVTLGPNEFASRVFAEAPVLPPTSRAWVRDRISRSRLRGAGLLDPLGPPSDVASVRDRFGGMLRDLLESDPDRPLLAASP